MARELTRQGHTVRIIATVEHIGYHKTLVAIANKHARIIWAMLVKGEDFDVQHMTPQVVAVAPA